MTIQIENTDKLIDIVYRGRESMDIEYKSSMHWKQPNTIGKVLKTVLAFANTPGGGYLVFGVEPDHCKPIGMSDEDYESFDEDTCRDKINNYSCPYIDVRMTKVELPHPEEPTKRKFVVFCVREAQDAVICKEDGPQDNNKKLVEKGRIYTRSLGAKYESKILTGEPEWTQLLQRVKWRQVERTLSACPHARSSNTKSIEQIINAYKAERGE